jgi:uncharacterized SAM-binding protein YcdF (DUF218 family)
VVRVVLIALVLAFLGLSARLFVFPDTNKPVGADAVVVLSGARKPRLNKGLELMRKGVAPTLVISDATAFGWREADRLCPPNRAEFKVICFRAKSYSTRGEAEEIGRLVREHDWKRVVVVTSKFHVSRARVLVKRCLKGRATVEMVAAHVPLTEWPRDVLFEWAKLIRAETISRGC